MATRLRGPVWWTNALQILKTVTAAVVAWVLAAHVFDIPQAFLAPWAALLTVHATVYRTFRRGAQQVGATVLGVLVAFALGSLLGLNALSLGLIREDLDALDVVADAQPVEVPVPHPRVRSRL